MFTGLVATMGTLAAITPLRDSASKDAEAAPLGARLAVTAGFDDGPLVLGESISVRGACLTVAAITAGGFEADASAETLARTTLGGLRAGDRLHLERALRAADRLGGHLVSGHVDGVGALVERRPVGESTVMAFEVPPELAKFVAVKGSIAVDGVSLTVNAVAGPRFEVTIIPHTADKTTLGHMAVGAKVNLEVDLIARYVARLLEAARP